MKQKVSLVIKACVQDVKVLYNNVKHIVKQLRLPNSFDEIILSLDIKERDFLREYYQNGDWEELLSICVKLKEEGIISDFYYPNKSDIPKINKKWFNLNSFFSHTYKKIPVPAQLFGFEKAKNDLILQLDNDIIIGRQDYSHSFLNDMIKEISNNSNILSVAFNIYHGKQAKFIPYFGNFVPEVRFCLLDRKKIYKLLPLPNKVLKNGLELSWYRALEKVQNETGVRSVRGGDTRSFFIHPQNNLKKDVSFIELVKIRVEQNRVPDIQIGKVDLAGSKNDWS